MNESVFVQALVRLLGVLVEDYPESERFSGAIVGDVLLVVDLIGSYAIYELTLIAD